jgi:hypothetical protein
MKLLIPLCCLVALISREVNAKNFNLREADIPEPPSDPGNANSSTQLSHMMHFIHSVSYTCLTVIKPISRVQSHSLHLHLPYINLDSI